MLGSLKHPNVFKMISYVGTPVLPDGYVYKHFTYPQHNSGRSGTVGDSLKHITPYFLLTLKAIV